MAEFVPKYENSQYSVLQVGLAVNVPLRKTARVR